MSGTFIVDTGPLVALINHRDHFHEWTVREFKSLKTPVYTCEAVLVETLHILGHGSHLVASFLASLLNGWLSLDFNLREQLVDVSNLIRKYESVPMSLADACLVRMAELKPESVILTFDRDFRVYRKLGRQTIPLILPPGH